MVYTFLFEEILNFLDVGTLRFFSLCGTRFLDCTVRGCMRILWRNGSLLWQPFTTLKCEGAFLNSLSSFHQLYIRILGQLIINGHYCSAGTFLYLQLELFCVVKESVLRASINEHTER